MFSQAALSARADKCREKSEKIKEGLEQKKEAFSDLSNKQAESINEKMVRLPLPQHFFRSIAQFLAVRECLFCVLKEEYSAQANAEARRTEENEKQLEKVRQMNNRVSEAEKKRGEMEPHDMSGKEAKIQSAEERKAAILKEAQDKGAAEIAKVHDQYTFSLRCICPFLRACF